MTLFLSFLLGWLTTYLLIRSLIAIARDENARRLQVAIDLSEQRTSQSITDAEQRFARNLANRLERAADGIKADANIEDYTRYYN